jgi:predicted esterase
MQEHHLTVSRTARYVTLGPLDRSAKDVWFALHGYGQLAARFARAFEPLESKQRLIVVPEGLSRYYVDHRTRAVGASWMTSEDRLHEIDDYLQYLDALAGSIQGAIPPDASLTLLGFSQGVATAGRWVAAGAPRLGRLILWGGTMPRELDPTGGDLNGIEVVLVRGDQDPLVSAETVAGQAAALQAAGVHHRTITFSGGHELNRGVLLGLAEGR